MAQTLVLIHTSEAFLTVETMMQGMFAEIMPDVRLINIMDDSLLPDVMAAQRISTDVARRMCAYVVAAEATGAPPLQPGPLSFLSLPDCAGGARVASMAGLGPSAARQPQSRDSSPAHDGPVRAAER